MPTHHPEHPTSKPFILFTAGATAYELVRFLGPRGPGEMLLARRHYAGMPGDLVVIKRLQDSGDERGRARLREEVKLLMRLSHPAIAQVFLVRVHEGSPHLVMEYVEGHSLETLTSFAALRRRPFSEAFAAYVGSEVADALHHAHTLEDGRGQPLGIVHRDVSPRTLRLDVHGRVKLADFAMAWAKLPGRVGTEGHVVRGDLAYASPEALLRRPLDGRSDLFSLGVVLLELLTGLHLLDLEDVERAALATGPLPEAESLLAEVPSWLPAPMMAARMACLTPAHVEHATRGLSGAMRAILGRLLRREPAERFQSGLELRDALRGVLAGMGYTYGPREAEREAAQVRRDARSRRRGADVLRWEDVPRPEEAPQPAAPVEP
ncbi:serine/threonine protein kinase [Pyxidicoccus fallax]|uniref:Serine/threonine protein kinase n=1 Tax=Pyxidicoccus fallax TaxID=394095 RepID=A0A848LEA0_9BACT|nr:serine/threonine-protein kinase [Pyxidicoccus fallax]NMO16714.1 serine/threonine protein kinase [Pyxidicoccus fallax]NPC81223.1 serine/threonine protein kinase [Pyxidicoccus fallax]